MKRLCLIVPNLQEVKRLAKLLEKHHVKESHVHVMGKHADRIDNANLHRASLLQTSDLVPALKRGLLFSVVLMALIFVVFYFTLPKGMVFEPGAVIGIVVAGLVFAVWAASLIGIGIPSKYAEATRSNIQRGQYIVMVDVPQERVGDLTHLIGEKMPKVRLAMPVEDADPLLERQ